MIPRGGWMLIATLLLSIILAGGRPLWAQGLVTLCIGLLWAVWPPVRLPTKSIVIALLALAVLPLAAFLPAIFSQPAWRTELAALQAVAISPLASPQPWYTFHTWLLWLAGIAFTGWCASQSWDHYNRETLARVYAGSLVGVVMFAIFAYASGGNPGLWESTDGFGPFANRNQWGSVMGMGAVVVLALLHQSLRRSNKGGVVFWGGALAVMAGAVITNGSRGGLLVMLAGGCAYGMFFSLLRKQYRYAAVSFSLFVLASAAFSLAGGALLERFVDTFQEGLTEDARVEFYRMTFNMVRDAPFTGFGLGNFQYVFPFYLDYPPIANTRPLHPENSFIWLASEGGLVLALACISAIGLLIGLGLTLRRSRATGIRSAGLACALMLVFNAFFEVSAHRIGALLPGIFLASLALPAPQGPHLSRGWRPVPRVVGLLIMFVGAIWLSAPLGSPIIPAIQGNEVLRSEAARAQEQGRPQDAAALLRRTAELAPLDWGAHWSLANFYLENAQPEEAWSEFRAVEALLPYMDQMALLEGDLWLRHDPPRAERAWNQAIQRTPPGKRAELYDRLLRKAAPHPELYVFLMRMNPGDAEFEFVRMRGESGRQVRRLQRILELTDGLQKAPDHMIDPLIRHLIERGHADTAEKLVTGKSRMERLAWKSLTALAERNGDKAKALELHFQHGPRPALPAPINRSDLRSVERAAALAPMDIATGIAYYQALEGDRRHDDAFWQLRRIMEFPDAPAYIWYLAARAAHERGMHEEAWGFLQTYEQKSKQ